MPSPALLRTSHIIPWARCADDAERPDVANGLLLSSVWDAAFDSGLITFADDGAPRFAPTLSPEARAALGPGAPLTLTDLNRARLAWHRAHLFEAAPGP